jgi:hypothetical protein
MTADRVGVLERLRCMASRSAFTLVFTGVLASLCAVLLAGLAVVLDPAEHVVLQEEAPSAYGTGSVRSRAEGDAIEQRAREASRKASECSRSSERRQQLGQDFRRKFVLLGGAVIIVTWLLFTRRLRRELMLVASPAVVIGALILIPL